MKNSSYPKIFVAGETGMVGSAIKKELKKKYYCFDCTRSSLDITNQNKVIKWFKKNKPDIVINAAGKVGGILDNSTKQDEYLYINTMIGMNLVHACFKNNVRQFINIGSACIYPKKKNIYKESHLLTSKLEPTNEGYAIAKISVLKFCEYIKKKFKKNYISLMPSNLYGPGDNFNLQASHVIPALVKKFYNAKISGQESVEVWGSGKVKRQFLHVKDFARLVKMLVLKEPNFYYANAQGKDFLSIEMVAKKIQKILKYKGKIKFNKNYPDGAEARFLDGTKLSKFGWKPSINIEQGLKNYIKENIKKF